MIPTLPIASAGEGLFWLIVAVFVLVSQIAKALKKGQNKGQPQRPASFPAGDDAASPEKELEDFLRKLAGGAQQAPPARPQPQPRTAPPLVKAAPARTAPRGHAGQPEEAGGAPPAPCPTRHAAGSPCAADA